MEQVLRKRKNSDLVDILMKNSILKKRKQQQAKDVSKKTCFKCQQVGHIDHKCPQNMKPVDVDKIKRNPGL
ncbi:putative transcription factor interactor and regulator CCHC(Zn) family [Helianthus anomalus]